MIIFARICFFIYGLLKLFLKEPSLCEKRWFCLTKELNEI